MAQAVDELEGQKPATIPKVALVTGTATRELRRAGSSPANVAWAAAAILAIPSIVALVVLREPRWYPGLEFAQTELHVRDVGTPDTPLTGLIGRLGPPGEGGSHPGPLSFFALAPAYRLAGSSPWSLQLATVALHLVALGVALCICLRRGGVRLVAPAAAAFAVLLGFYGPSLLTEPWNPYLPLLWWLTFLLAVWSVLEGDLPLLPVAVFAGTLCAQTHIAYLGPTLALGAAAAGVAVFSAGRARRRHDASLPWGWLGLAAATAAVLWLPPILDELRNTPGNLVLLRDHFSDPPDEPIGLRRGIEVVLANLDPIRLLTGEETSKARSSPDHWPLAGSVYVGVWAATTMLAGRLRQWSVVRLDAVLGLGLVVALASTSRIHGETWGWLLLWAWGLAALIAVAIAWTLATWAEPARGRSPPVKMLVAGVLTAAALVSLVRVTTEAARVEPDQPRVSRTLRSLVPATVKALGDGAVTGGGRSGRYLVRWFDPVGVLGALHGFGVVNELDRAGFTVAIDPVEHLRAAPYLTAAPDEVTAAVNVVLGSAIEDWERLPGVRRVAAFDPRSPQERSRQGQLLEKVTGRLEELELTSLVDLLDVSILGVLLRIETDARLEMAEHQLLEVIQIGVPGAVFVGPTGVSPGSPEQ